MKRQKVSVGIAPSIRRVDGTKVGRPIASLSRLRDLIMGRALLLTLVVLSAILICAIAETKRYAWLELVALAPLYWAIREGSPGLGFSCGTLWGGCLALLQALGFGDFIGGDPNGLLMLVAPGIYGGLGSWLTRRIGFSPLTLGVGWMAVEFLLGPGGNSLGLVGTTEGGILHFAGQLFGYVAVGCVIAYLNSLLVCLVVRLSFGIPRIMRGSERATNHFREWSRVAICERFLSPAQPRAPPTYACPLRL